MKNKLLLVIAAAALFSCQKDKKEELTHLLTRDSIQYFNVYRPGDFKIPMASFSFGKDGKNEQYTFRHNARERFIVPLSDEPNNMGMTNSWKVLNDSTIQLTGAIPMVIDRYTEDTLYMSNERDGSTIWIREKGDPMLNEEALYARDSLFDMMKRRKESQKQ